MIAASSEVILLVDSSKFGRDSMVRVAPIEAVTRIITDPGIDSHMKSHLREVGVELVIAIPEAAAVGTDLAEAALDPGPVDGRGNGHGDETAPGPKGGTSGVQGQRQQLGDRDR